MDPNALALAGTAGTTVVTLLATDAWEQTRDGVVALWRRARGQAAEAEVEAQLTEAHESLLTGTDAEVRAVHGRLESEWQLRFGGLLAEHPGAAEDLAALLAELTAAQSGTTVRGDVRFEAHAEGSGHVYQSFGRQTVHHHG